MTSLDPSTLATVTGGGFVRNTAGAIVGTATGTVGGLAVGTYKVVTEKNDWQTFGTGFSRGWDSAGGFGQRLGRGAVDAVSGAYTNVRDNWGK